MLQKMQQAFEQLGEPMTPHAVDIGLWHWIQANDLTAASEWALIKATTLQGNPEAAEIAAGIASQIDSWGSRLSSVGRAFRDAILARLGVRLEEPVFDDATEPFRRFIGTNKELTVAFHAKAHEITQEARLALEAGDADVALAVLDKLGTEASGGLPDHMTGVILSLQVHALSHRFPSHDVDSIMDVMRDRLLDSLAFSALARLEASMAWIAASSGNADVHRRATERAFIADLAEDPRARASLLFWEGVSRGRSPDSTRIGAGFVAARYYGTAEEQFLQVQPGVVDGSKPDANDVGEADEAVRVYTQVLETTEDPTEVDTALANAVATLTERRQLTRLASLRLRGDRANWLLRTCRYEQAVAAYRSLQQEVRAANDLHGALNALAGEARTLSRTGNYEDAVRVFETALEDVVDTNQRGYLLRGLAACHLLEGTERRPIMDLPLVELAIEKYKAAIEAARVNDRERPLARLGLARALGQKGKQSAALYELDSAIREFAHVGSPYARTLMQGRRAFTEGYWDTLLLE
jgi:tetratricopeptide (TPR) repeat protein